MNTETNTANGKGKNYFSVKTIDQKISDTPSKQEESRRIAEMYFIQKSFPETTGYHLEFEELNEFYRLCETVLDSGLTLSENQEKGYWIAFDKVQQANWKSW